MYAILMGNAISAETRRQGALASLFCPSRDPPVSVLVLLAFLVAVSTLQVCSQPVSDSIDECTWY